MLSWYEHCYYCMFYHTRLIKLFSVSSHLGGDTSQVLIDMINRSIQLKLPLFLLNEFSTELSFLLTSHPGSNIWHSPRSLSGLQLKPEIFGLATTSMKTSMRKKQKKKKKIFPSTNTEASLDQSGSFWENGWYSCCCCCRVVRRLKEKI